jgi:hypothetical protein
MMKVMAAAALGAATMMSAGAASAAHNLEVSAHYDFGCYTATAGYCGDPDTSFVTFTNNGAKAWTGMIGDVADTACCGSFSQGGVITLAPGASFTFGTSPESSNFGGFGPDGMEIDMGNFKTNDEAMHSGVFRTNPFGVTLDNFVLQGGDPFGRDTGDAYEVTQADSHAFFISSAVPEPGAWAMMLVGVGALGGLLRRRSALA